MTMTKLPNHAVNQAIREGNGIDHQSRIDALTKQLDRVKKDIAEQERVEKRVGTVQRAFAKLKREMGKTLTKEEWQAIDGAYIFLHAGCVDLVRHIPSATSKGEDTRLEKDLDTAEALKELEELVH